MNMRKVVLESPFSGDIKRNVRYARACIKDCLGKNDAPIASHLLFTQPGIIDDNKFEHRMMGMAAGHVWISVCDAVVVYEDLGISKGMEVGIAVAKLFKKPIEFRKLDGWTKD